MSASGFKSIVFAIVAVFAVSDGWAQEQRPKAALPRNLALEKLLEKTPEEISRIDVAEMNLICASGLPGAHDTNVPENMKLLDDWATAASAWIEFNLPRYRQNPAKFRNSEKMFRLANLVNCLRRQFNVSYKPEMMGVFSGKDPERNEMQLRSVEFMKDSRDVFISGVLSDARTGTCSSLPVAYVAVARRLGFPVKLVTTKGHLFIRWEDSQETFNLEVTGEPSVLPDDHYRKWPLPITDDEVARGQYLKSLSPVEELAIFLEMRAACLRAHGYYDESLIATAHALRLRPSYDGNLQTLRHTSGVVTDRLPPTQEDFLYQR